MVVQVKVWLCRPIEEYTACQSPATLAYPVAAAHYDPLDMKFFRRAHMLDPDLMRHGHSWIRMEDAVMTNVILVICDMYGKGQTIAQYTHSVRLSLAGVGTFMLNHSQELDALMDFTLWMVPVMQT